MATISIQGFIHFGTSLGDHQTPLIAVKCVLRPLSRPHYHFLGLKYRKISLETHPFCILFQVPPSCVVFDSHGLREVLFW